MSLENLTKPPHDSESHATESVSLGLLSEFLERLAIRFELNDRTESTLITSMLGYQPISFLESPVISTRYMLFLLTLTSCASLVPLSGCHKTSLPDAKPKLQATPPSGTFYPHEELSEVDTPRLTSACFPKVRYGSANGRLAYLIVTDFPMGSDNRLDVTAHYDGSTIDKGTIEIEGRVYRLGNGRVILIDTAGGPDRVRQIAMPTGASAPEAIVRQLFKNDVVFREFLKSVLYARLDSVSLRSEAAIGLYKSKLAYELPEAELRGWLDDDSAWVRLMAASGLWDKTQAPEAVDILSSLVESEQPDTWPAKLARRKLARIRVGHSQRSTAILPPEDSDNGK